MSKYPIRKPAKKAVTININLDNQENENDLRDLIKKGESLLQTLQEMNEDRLERTTSEIEKVKRSIEDIGKE